MLQGQPHRSLSDMVQNLLLLGSFLVELVLLYLISRQTTKELFTFFRKFFSDSIVFVLITLIFLPGTIIHELAHYFMAIILFLNVREISVLPEFQKNYIKLGKVVYEKKDIVRGILVGIAPIFAGLFIFWLLSLVKIFPNSNIFITIGLSYLIFVISTTMFSSKQDLVDIAFIIPILLCIGAIIFIFNINLAGFLEKTHFWTSFNHFIQQLNFYFLLSFAIHIILIIVLKSIHKLWHR